VGCDLQSTTIASAKNPMGSQVAFTDNGQLVRSVQKAEIDAAAQLLPPIRSLGALAADEGALASPRGRALLQTEIAVKVEDPSGGSVPEAYCSVQNPWALSGWRLVSSLIHCLDITNRWLTVYETGTEALGHVARQVLRTWTGLWSTTERAVRKRRRVLVAWGSQNKNGTSRRPRGYPHRLWWGDDTVLLSIAATAQPGDPIVLGCQACRHENGLLVPLSTQHGDAVPLTASPRHTVVVPHTQGCKGSVYCPPQSIVDTGS